jgi:GNAT superfamily N-acetyltransferase
MIDDWFEVLRLPISFELFRSLPQNPAYKYEYLGEYALLSPRPKSYHARLELKPTPAPEIIEAWRPVVVRPLQDDDWERLPKLFSAAFHRVQPFAGLADERRLVAARLCLEKTRSGGDGPLIAPACMVAVAEDDHPVGAALVTIRDDVEGWDEEDVRSVAHLTWIFVAPLIARHGIGSALLALAVNALVDAGHGTLASTFLLGNESRMLWHWRNGFRLLSYPGSPRRIREFGRRTRPKAGPGR